MSPSMPCIHNHSYNCAAHRFDCLPPPLCPAGLPSLQAEAELVTELTTGATGVTGSGLDPVGATEAILVSANTAVASAPAATAVVSEAMGSVSAAAVVAIEALTAATGEPAAASVLQPTVEPGRATALSPAVS